MYRAPECSRKSCARLSHLIIIHSTINIHLREDSADREVAVYESALFLFPSLHCSENRDATRTECVRDCVIVLSILPFSENRMKMADAGGGKAVDTEEGGAKSKDIGGDGGQDCPRYNLPFLNLTADSPTNMPVETEIVESRRKMAEAGGGNAVGIEEGVVKSTDTGADGGQDCPRYNLPFLNLTADSPTNTPVETEIVGKIPTWLEGSLYRNGPGIFRVGDVHLKHLFDGFAILHRFHLHGGKVTYTSRVLDTDTYERSIKTKRLVATQFGTFLSPDPCKSIFGKVMSFFKPQVSDLTDNVGVNIVEHGDRLYALTETPWLVRVHPHTLLKEDRENLTRTIAVHMSSAHPHFDKEGNMYNLATALNPPNNYNIVKIPPASTPDAEVVQGAQLLVSLQSRWSFSIGYNHSFGMSREHYVILEQPITMGSMKFLTNNWRKAAFYDCVSKHPNEELVFRVVRRQDNQEVKVKFRAEAAFTFHFINCFEDQGHLVVDFAGYSDLSVIDQLYLKNLDKGGLVPAQPLFRRYVIPLTLEQKGEGVNLVTLPNTSATAVHRRDGTVFLSPDYITEGVVMELPRINYGKVSGEKYRYVYGTRFFSENPQLVKLDVEKKAVMTWTPDEGYQPGEPVFVPKPEGTLEDDGVILSPVVGLREDQRCYLVALDAATFQELGRAYAPKGVQMSISFHGSYVQPKADKK